MTFTGLQNVPSLKSHRLWVRSKRIPGTRTFHSIALPSRRRPQWQRGLKHELSSLARLLGLWVRIPLEAWMSVCVYSVFVLGSGLTTGWSLIIGVIKHNKSSKVSVQGLVFVAHTKRFTDAICCRVGVTGINQPTNQPLQYAGGSHSVYNALARSSIGTVFVRVNGRPSTAY
jgi:hypothetical protein